MPIPKPKPDQERGEFIAECILQLSNEYTTEQAAAICYDAWVNKDEEEDEEEHYNEEEDE